MSTFPELGLSSGTSPLAGTMRDATNAADEMRTWQEEEEMRRGQSPIEIGKVSLKKIVVEV